MGNVWKVAEGTAGVLLIVLSLILLKNYKMRSLVAAFRHSNLLTHHQL